MPGSCSPPRATPAPVLPARFFSRPAPRASCATSGKERLPFLPPSDAILGMEERARLDALLERLRPVVLLHPLAHPREDLARHLDAVDRVAAVHPASGLFRAHRDMHGQRFLALHAPENEHARIR